MPRIVEPRPADVVERAARQAANQHAGNGRDLDDADRAADGRGRNDFLDDALLGRRKDGALEAE